MLPGSETGVRDELDVIEPDTRVTECVRAAGSALDCVVADSVLLAPLIFLSGGHRGSCRRAIARPAMARGASDDFACGISLPRTSRAGVLGRAL